VQADSFGRKPCDKAFGEDEVSNRGYRELGDDEPEAVVGYSVRQHPACLDSSG
jgi:hypothetical protein